MAKRYYGADGNSENIGEFASVRQFGAKGDGATDNYTAFSEAMAYAIEQQIPLYIPKGEYYLPNNAPLMATTCDELTIYGDGDDSVLLFDDYVNPTTFTPLILGDVTETIGKMVLRDFRIHGKWSEESDFTENSTILYFWHVLDLFVDNITIENSRSGMLLVEDCEKAIVRGSRFINSYRDACRLMETESATVTGNYFKCIQDDSIAISTRDDSRVYDDSQTIIADNHIIDSQGIAALGAKKTVINGNIFNRAMVSCITVGGSQSFDTGHTPILGLEIVGNVITDVFTGTLFSVDSGSQNHAIQVSGLPMLAKDTVGSWDGAEIVSHYDHAYNFGADASGGVNAGNWNAQISNNTISRTLPAAAAYSDYGHGERLSRSGYVDPAITDDDLYHSGIEVYGSAYNLKISDNTVVGGLQCVTFDATGLSGSFASTTWRNILIDGNTFYDWINAAVTVTKGTGSIDVMRNDFNGDPYVRRGQRDGTTGGWSVNYAAHACVNVSDGGCNAQVRGNQFRNVGIPVVSGSNIAIQKGNIQYCEPSSTGHDSGNKGIGFIHTPANIGSFVIEDCTPNSATFGQVLNECEEGVTGNAPPSSGTYVEGAFVYNSSNLSQIYGWKRGTTGSTHTVGGVGNDWIVIWGTA